MSTVVSKKKKSTASDTIAVKRRKKIANTLRSMNRILGNPTGTSEQNRNMKQECGYPDTVTFQMICDMYDREGVAQRVVHVYPVETWKTSPDIYEIDEQKVTPFEQRVKEVVDQFNLWSVLERADKMSGLGCFGVVLLGFSDGRKLHRPVQEIKDDTEGAILKPRKSKPLDLLYVRVFDQRQVSIKKLEDDPTSPRYGRPVLYGITMTSPAEATISPVSSAKETTVHWSRIVHLADNRQASEIAGVPRLEPAYNRILDLLKVLGGSSEMFWKGGFPGLSFEVQPGIGDIDFDEDSFRQAIDDYANGLQRILRTVGIKVNSLAPQVADPTPQVDAGMDQICITVNCPKRIFLGTESAHLASTQDQKTWSDRIGGRRTQYAIPYIIRPFFRRLIMAGVLPFVETFHVDWKDPEEVDPLVRAQSFEKIVNAMAQYVSSGMSSLFPPLEFLTELFQIPLDAAERIVAAAEEQAKGEPTIPLVGATDELEQQKAAMEAGLEAKKAAVKATGKPGSSGTNTPVKSGRKSGSGRRRESKPVSTGQNG
jgi:hypothetical protein